LDEETNCGHGSQLCDNRHVLVVCFDRLVHEDGVSVEHLLPVHATCTLDRFRKNNDGLRILDKRLLKLSRVQRRPLDEKDVFEAVNLRPDIRVTIDVVSTHDFIRENDDRSFLITECLAPQGQNQILDSFHDAAHDDVPLDVLRQ